MEMEMEMEMGSQQFFGHGHPMVFNEVASIETKEATCSRCGDKVSGSSFSCAECEVYLHKECAEAPSEIHHPFHRKHPLVLLPHKPKEYKGRARCDLCGENCEKFLYHCSCNLDLHIKCALFSLNIVKKKLGELDHVPFKVPLLSVEADDKEVERIKCFWCREPLLGSMYFPLDCGFNLHKKCAELPPILDLPCHRKHPLIIQFNHQKRSCMICQETRRNELGYCCLSCKFYLHFECAFPPLTIKEKIHQHPFSLFWRQDSFICDACGLKGNCVSYICSTCNLVVHEDCISLPPIIKIPRHKHPIFHNFSLHGFRKSECSLCYDKVKTQYGSYSCFNCKFIVHVKCALEKEGWYQVIEAKDRHDLEMVPKMSTNPIICVIERNEDGEMTKIRHRSHVHDLTLRDNLTEEDCDSDNLMGKYCDGCVLPISDQFYSCSECDFLLHKTCAKLPKEKQLWFHICQRPLILVVGHIFRCGVCRSECNGFSYSCKECDVHYCLQCSTGGYTIKHEGHEHLLYYDRNREERCSACNVKRRGLFKCKTCSFNLHIKCLGLPLTTWHKCDEHLLALTYKEDNKYKQYLYCDICEQKRDPSHWFYHCATCDTSAHTECALGRYPFIKQGSVYKELEDHPHPLTFVKKIYSGPRCNKCGKACRDLGLECAESACNYIVHWDCAKPDYLRIRKTAVFLTETDEVVKEDTKTEGSCIIL